MARVQILGVMVELFQPPSASELLTARIEMLPTPQESISPAEGFDGCASLLDITLSEEAPGLRCLGDGPAPEMHLLAVGSVPRMENIIEHIFESNSTAWPANVQELRIALLDAKRLPFTSFQVWRN